jgi:hypothetical protein
LRRRLILLAALALGACDPGPPSFHGVQLGMAPRDVRDRFDVKGKFEVEPSSGDDFIMKFAPSHATTLTAAQFEFHGGALVAVRADVTPADPADRGDAFVISQSAVLHRVRKPDLAHIDLIARDCPTHRAEAERLVRSSSRAR